MKRSNPKGIGTARQLKGYLTRPSLVGRMLTVLLVWGMLFYLLSLGIGWFTAHQALQDNSRQQALDAVSKLDEYGTPLYVSASGMNRLLEQKLSAMTNLVYVSYYSASGKELMARYVREDVAVESIPPLSYKQVSQFSNAKHGKQHLFAEYEDNSSVVRLVVPIWVRSLSGDGLLAFDMSEQSEKVQLIGYMDFALDFDHYRQQLWINMGQGSFVLALVFLLSLLAGRFVITRTLAPLARLKEPLEKLAEGKINQPLQSEELEELQPITLAMNHAIESLQERDQELQRIAATDPLTGLLSRNAFSGNVERVLETVSESVLIFVDLDDFKSINDKLGHVAGDRLLVEVASLLTHCVPLEALVGRFGGDEFSVLLPNTDQQEGVNVAEAILSGFRNYQFYQGGVSFNIYCSIGVAAYRGGGAEHFWNLADKACFKAKTLGRNRYHVSDSISGQVEEEIRWADMLRDALSHDHFEVLFQPVITTDERKLVQYELLLRLRYGDQLFPPSLFFPVAERLGMMLEIDRWMLEKGVPKAAEMAAEYPGVKFRINLSAHIVEDPEFVGRLRSSLEQSPLVAEQLIFEMAENVLMHNLSNVVPVLEKLRALGCMISIDDFAMGLHSFQTLKHLPVSYLKLAGDFVDGWAQLDDVGKCMVRSIRELAAVSGQQLIADNLSIEQDLTLLSELGVPLAQGRYVGAPIGLNAARMQMNSAGGEEFE